MFRNKKYMAWNFHLFLNLVSICCETFRNVSNFGLSHFWLCFNLFQSIYYIIYMFQCFETKNIWPGIFTFSETLFQFVAKRFETFQSLDLVIFWPVSICFNVSLKQMDDLGFSNIVAKRFETLQQLFLKRFETSCNKDIV